MNKNLDGRLRRLEQAMDVGVPTNVLKASDRQLARIIFNAWDSPSMAKFFDERGPEVRREMVAFLIEQGFPLEGENRATIRNLYPLDDLPN